MAICLFLSANFLSNQWQILPFLPLFDVSKKRCKKKHKKSKKMLTGQNRYVRM